MSQDAVLALAIVVGVVVVWTAYVTRRVLDR